MSTEFTRRDIEKWLGCQVEWFINGKRSDSKVFARFRPVSPYSIDEMLAYWRGNGWDFANSWDDPTSEYGVRVDGNAGQYSKVFLDKRGGFLWHQFWAKRTHYLTQHWWDILPAKLWDVIRANLYSLGVIPLIDCVQKDVGLVYTVTLAQSFEHFRRGTKGDHNLPILKLIGCWKEEAK